MTSSQRQPPDQRAQQLLEAAPDAMVVVDGRGVICLVNAATERLFGYARQELIGEPIEILVPESVTGRHVHLRDGYIAHPSESERLLAAGDTDAAGRVVHSLKGVAGNLGAKELKRRPRPQKGRFGTESKRTALALAALVAPLREVVDGLAQLNSDQKKDQVSTGEVTADAVSRLPPHCEASFEPPRSTPTWNACLNWSLRSRGPMPASRTGCASSSTTLRTNN
jgi:PAS domain S-box-containing protein